MDENERAAMLETMRRLESKLDEMLEFRDLVISFVGAGAVKKFGLLAKAKLPGGQ